MNITLSGIRIRWYQVEMRSYRVRGHPNSIQFVSIQKEERHRHRQEKSHPCEDEVKDWNYAATSH